MTSGCGGDGRPTDNTAILHALLGLLASDGKPVCLDHTTQGKPLAVFRSMVEAPYAGAQHLSWYRPAPFRPTNRVTSRDIFDDQIDAGRVVLKDPQQRAATPLPDSLQAQVTVAARRLSIAQDDSKSWIAGWDDVPLAHPRWWIFNQFDSDCGPIYSVSDLIVAKNVAFLSVSADHWGTTYAFQKKGGAWSPLAQWTSWLY